MVCPPPPHSPHRFIMSSHATVSFKGVPVPLDESRGARVFMFRTPHPGGAPVNVACALGRLGDSVALISALGDDEFGDHLIALLKGEQTDIRLTMRRIRLQRAPASGSSQFETKCFRKHIRTQVAEGFRAGLQGRPSPDTSLAVLVQSAT